MGLFSKKPSDTKARIEELKKKIQAEQQAYTQTAAAPAPVPIQAAPAPAPVAPTPQPAPPMQVVQVAPAPVQVAEPAPVHYTQPAPVQTYQPPAPRVYVPNVAERARMAPPAPRQELIDLEEIKTGIVLDLGDGMSLNVPIKGKMHLDEFLHIADRVRELQRLQQPHERWQ